MHRTPALRLGVAVTLAGSVGATVAGFAPWLRSGEVQRSSFEVVRLADHLELAHGVGHQVAIAVWYLLPALSAGVVLASVLHRWAVMCWLATIVGAVALIGGALTLSAPLPSEWGAPMAMVAGVIAWLGVVLTGLARSRTSPARTRAR